MKNKIEEFIKKYKTKPEYAYKAPSRVNLIGEHIDYNGGYVLPMSISLYTYIFLSKREDKNIVISSKNFKYSIKKSLDDLSYCASDGFASYPLGIFNNLVNKGINIENGYNIYYFSEIPLGSGLSSSASILDSTIYALNDILNLKLSLKEMAIISYEVETKYMGLSCGIMDQAAIMLGKKDMCLKLNCSNFTYEYKNAKLDNLSIAILKTNKKRKLTESKYNDRVIECNKALEILKSNYNINMLCDKYIEEDKIRALIVDKDIANRAIYAINENKRVLDFIDALDSKDYNLCGKLLNESHDSLKNLYEVTGPHLDMITSIARQSEYCLGSRMTGAGFGGCAIALIKNEGKASFVKEVEAKYESQMKIKGEVIIVSSSNGPEKIDI